MTKVNYERKGFTLVEALVASAIIVIVIAGSLAFYLMARTAWMDCSKRVPLQRKASVAMEKMVRGINGTKGIREAQEISSPAVGLSANRIDFVDGEDDDLTRTFYFYPGADGNASTEEDNQLKYIETDGTEKEIIKNNLKTLTFTHSSTSIVIIELGMRDKVRDKDIDVNISTTVRIRN